MPVLVQRLISRVTWVKKTTGERKGEQALVLARDVENNIFTVRFKNDQHLTPRCNPEEWDFAGVPGTVARGQLK